MSDLSSIPPDRPITPAEAADLRHDLVTPLNLVIGYCDLLNTEPSLGESAELLGRIRAIRQHGFALLRSIDRALLSDLAVRSTADLRGLGPLLDAPAAAIIAACDGCLGAPPPPELSPEAHQDLSRIRAAGQQMLERSRCLAAGSYHPDATLRSTTDATR